MQKPSISSTSPATAILATLLFVAAIALTACQTMDPSVPGGFSNPKPSQPTQPSQPSLKASPAPATAQPVYRFLDVPLTDDDNTNSTNEIAP